LRPQAPRFQQQLVRTARQLLAFAVQKGCPATSSWLLQLLADLGVGVEELASVSGPVLLMLTR
jgi:hypothetical protein